MKSWPARSGHGLVPSLVGLVVAPLMIGSALAAEQKDEEAADSVVQLKPVTVTAEKITATEQDTPVSMTVVSGEDLERGAAKDTIDVVRQIPNMHMIKAGQHASVAFFSMRGVTPFMEGEQPVGYFVDGVHFANIDTELLDIDRIEVLRGPQSTLYGRNTEAGAVNVITRDPEPYQEGSVALGYGTYNQKTLSAVNGGALGASDWSYRAALRVLDGNGYFTRDPGDVNRVDDANDINARLKVRWNPNDTWDVIATYDGQRYREGSTNIAFLSTIESDPHTVQSDYIGTNTTTINSGNIRAVYRADAATLTAISALTKESKRTGYDLDFTAADQMIMQTDVNSQRFSQELRLSSPDGASGPRWVGGLYYFDQTGNNNVDLDVRGYYTQSIRTRTDTLNMAAFGQVTWPVIDQVDLITGLRYDHEKKEVRNSRAYSAYFSSYHDETDMSFEAWLPKVGIEYKPVESLLTFLSYSEGYKAGGFNNLGTRGKETFDAEHTRNYEIGLKHEGLNNRLRSRLSLFWIDWTDQQVEQNILTVSNISNAGKSVSRGVEAEFAFQASKQLVLKMGGGWNDAHFIEYNDDDGDYSGNRPPNSPEFNYSLGGDYSFDDGLYLHADWVGNSGFYYDTANTVKQDFYALLNFKVGYQLDPFDVSFWIKNALDEVYVTRAFDSGTSAGYAGIAGDPRTFGLTVAARW